MKRLFRGWSWEHWYNLAREDIEEAFASVRRATRYVVYVGLALWVLSGFHAVGPNEVGLETFCGRLLRKYEEPGLRYRMPWPIGSFRRVPMKTQQTVAVGMAKGGLTDAERLGRFEEKALEETMAEEVTGVDREEDSALRDLIQAGGEGQGYDTTAGIGDGLALLSGDHNLIRVFAVVQYMITDPVRYVYGSEGADLMLRRAATSALLKAVAGTSVDDVLTSERVRIQSAVQSAINGVAQEHRLGITVASVQLQRVAAPNPVAAAFNDVSTAREERETLVNQANQYRATEVPRRQAEASRMVNDAKAYSADRLATASGERSRFAGLLREHQQNGAVTAERLRLETIEQVMSQVKKVFVGGAGGTTSLTIVQDGPNKPKQ